jgi:hypothetical protein
MPLTRCEAPPTPHQDHTESGTRRATQCCPGWNRQPRTLATHAAEPLRASLRETDDVAGVGR